MEAIAPQALQGVDTHPAQHLLDLQAPAAQEIDKTPGAYVRVYSLAQDGVGGADAPGTLAG